MKHIRTGFAHLALRIAVFTICVVGPASAGPLTQWEYKVVTWGELYTPLMREIEKEGEFKFFTDPEKKLWMIGPNNAGALMSPRTDEYFVEQLNKLGLEGWELTAVAGENSTQTYFFKRKKKD